MKLNIKTIKKIIKIKRKNKSKHKKSRVAQKSETAWKTLKALLINHTL
jgi:hypothetical protein